MKKFITILNIFFIFYYFNNLSADENNWFHSAGNFNAHKYSILKDINTENISNLKIAWTYKNSFFSKEKINNQLTPIFTGNSLITSTLDGYLVSIDPSSGFENWKILLEKPVAKRGLSFLEKERIIFVPSGSGVIAIDEKNGNIINKIGKNGFFGNSLSLVAPIPFKENIFIAFNKKIESFSIKNGEKNWSLDLNNARVWSGFSFDEETQILAITTSNLINLWGETKINPDFSNSLILIDSQTGKVKCRFKDVLHDHWDLDMQGNPIFINLNIQNKAIKAVYAFSKTGNVFFINVNTCDFVFNKKENFSFLDTMQSENKSQTYSEKQLKILLPEPLIDQKYNLYEYLENLNSKEKIDYIKFKTKRAKFNEDFIPLSQNYDVIMYGLHGGPSWSGGSFDKNNNQIIIPTNHNPWIIRSFYEDRLLNKIVRTYNNIISNFVDKKYLSPWQVENYNEIKIKKIYSYFTDFFDLEGSNIYKQKCQSCHGIAREGLYQGESEGDKYIPSLIGISLNDKFQSLNNEKSFNNSHFYQDFKKNVSKKELETLKNYFTKYDKFLKKYNLLIPTGRWQLFLDDEKLPASKSPWGKINAIDINTGKINWSIPFGVRENKQEKYIGDYSFGGVLSTAGGLLFATGTPDKYFRVFESKTGKNIWEYKLDLSGSSSPMTFKYKDEQYIVLNASGGRFFGYDNEIRDQIIAFKIK